MIDSYVLLTPILLLPIVALLGFVGCDWVLGLEPRVPNPPVLSAVAGNARVTLSWPEGQWTGRHHVKRGETSGVHEFLDEVPAGISTYPDTTVMNGTTYFYVVTAAGSNGESAPSNEEIVTPAAVLLTAFIGPISSTSATVTATGWFGVELALQSPVTIKTLGRAFATGNGQIHVMKVVEVVEVGGVRTETDVPGTLVALNMVGPLELGYRYTALSSAVTISGSPTAGITYYILSQETVGGDGFYNHTTMLTTTGVATATGSVRGDGTTHQVDATGSIAYGIVNFQY
ncbi:MAG: hypothetical protein M3R07_05330 [Gemmatimonadota bacterium]|nr:hypothetical protein [Gemmatimonadota bacterium]